MPIERAVPAIILAAASSLEAFRSFCLTLAISLSWALVTLPIFSLLGVAEPFARPAACYSSTEAGGLFTSMSKVLSEYTVTTTEVIVPL